MLNAGSSSLKFSVYRTTGRRGLAAGSARTDRRHRHLAAIHRQRRRRRARSPTSGWTRGVDGRGALDALAAWLRSRYGGARVLGVGHRVVHGGAAVRRSDDRHAGGPRRIFARSIPLAPLHQPYNLAAIEAVVRAAARRAAGRVLRHQLSSRPAGGRRAGSAAARDLPRRRAALRLPRPVVRVHRVGPAAGGAGDRRAAA